MSNHPFIAADYHIKWDSLTPEHIEPDIDAALEISEKNLEAIRQLDDEALTYENTFAALESATEDLERAWGKINHLDSVMNSDDLRAGLNAVLPRVTAFYASISLDAAIWAKLKEFADSPAAAELDATRQRFVEETCADFIQSGADLPDGKKSRVAEIQSRLSEITQKYSENVLDATNAWELVVDDELRLAGLPASAMAAAAEDAKAHGHEGKWRFTLQYPSMAPVLQHADDESFRKEIWEASCTVGYGGNYDNTDLIWEILKLRQEKAELLGFENFADLTLARRMAGSGSTAMQFTEDLHDKIVGQFNGDTQDLQAWKAKQDWW